MTLLALTFVVIGSVVAGSPAGAAGLDACNNDDAPIPASPHGAGSWIVQLGESPKDGDPFDDDGVTLEATYGTTPQLWTYDNGCTGQFVAGAGTAIGNILLQVSGAIPNWTHALLAAVVDPDSPVQALDNPVVDATRAVTEGVWRPWITIAVLLVAATAIWRARTGHIAGSATAVAWAGVVMLGTTLLISYPAESVRLVDDGVRNAVTLIATGFEDHPAPGENPAVAAINGQMDEVVRSTQYRTWLTGALGDADSATAREHGPDLFRATHFTFDEYETYRSDPEGEGKAIVEEKQDAFKTIAEQIDREDSVAYEYFTGEHWGQRVTAGLVNLVAVIVTCGYLLIAGLAILLAFVLIRLIVPFAPAAGILFMFDRTRDLAVGWLHRVIGPLVMGPIYFVVALCLLRFFSAVLTNGQVHYTLKLAVCAVLTYVAWRFTRPAAYGVGHIWGAAGFAWGMATGWRRQAAPYLPPPPEEPPAVATSGRQPQAIPGQSAVGPTAHGGQLPALSAPVPALPPSSQSSIASAPSSPVRQFKKDTFDASRAATYTSGDAYLPGDAPAHLPATTFQPGDSTPGWRAVNRGPYKPWMGYQEQITGVQRTPSGHIPEYHLPNPETGSTVKFDGHTQRGEDRREVFLEAKRGYRVMVFKPDSKIAISMADSLVSEANRQLDVLPEDAELEWHVSDEFSANKMRTLLAQQGIFEIEVIYTPEI
ncbi:Tox-REase-5 domain-containing protein [Nocardioides sp. YIM B13467]|uniref:Tox-REase-5 domain-containing protein n=1 Tax=Nocardioides sp. YIM B13467 TaxID=3366294 RepID=UPI003672633F